LLLCALATIVGYAMTAVVITAATPVRLPRWPTLVLQLASSFANRLAPSGLGATALTVRYLERKGATRSSAAASVVVKGSMGVAVRVILFVALLPFFGGVGRGRELPDDERLLIALAGVLAVLGLVSRVVHVPPRWSEAVRCGCDTAWAVVRRPRRALVLLGGTAAVTLLHVVGMYFALHSVGAGTTFVDTTLVYLVAGTIGSLSPLPGGLGAFEAALVTGLAATSTSPAAAAAAVLLFRLVTFWLPVLPGFLAFGWLRRAGHV
jgi:undecaprenyl-diphosphatase